ncbi:MAG TPA: hypothetical protein VFP91_06660 [Vicinamibacterales bacterium]|nr:hypothetical protein [Vicinamibacterales bacterium]
MKRAIAALLLAGTAVVVAQPTIDVAAVLKTVVPDLDQRLARFKPVKMPYNSAALSQRERDMVDQLVIALRELEDMYWRQSDPEALALYNALAADKTPLAQNLRRYLFINGSRFDLVDGNKPFVGTMPMPPGHALYPAGLTRADIEAYVAKNPARKPAIYNPYTVVTRTGPNGADLSGEWYHSKFAAFTQPAAAALRKAADLSDDPAFANFLRLRATAILTDDYYNSDIAWIDLKNPKFDVIYAPYETYLDDLLGVKTSYGASILIRNDAESQKLALYERYVADIQDSLPIAPEDRPSVRGHATPMEVMDAPLRAGDLRHGYQAVADNLPNDPRIHQQKGTKKIFFKNFMDARVNEVILPLAARVMDPAQAKQASANGYLASTLMHEICHGLGPAFARVNGKQTDIREAIGGLYGGLEEAKADVVGMHALKWLVDKGALPKSRLEEYYASYVAGIFRTVRFGTGEAHGRAEMMEFNYLSEQGAITSVSGKYRVEFAKMPAALAALAKELLEQEATGNRSRTEAWFAKYDRMPPALTNVLASAKGVPIDIDPLFSFAEPVR